MTGWPDFFIAMAGAAAALSGTLLVAMSINVARIVSQPTLPGRAANTLVIIATALMTSAVALMPVAPGIVGWAATGLGVALLVSAIHVVRVVTAHRGDGQTLIKIMLSMTGPVVVPAPYMIGGAMLIAQQPAGLYLLGMALLASLAVSLLNSWVLLVEILH